VPPAAPGGSACARHVSAATSGAHAATNSAADARHAAAWLLRVCSLGLRVFPSAELSRRDLGAFAVARLAAGPLAVSRRVAPTSRRQSFRGRRAEAVPSLIAAPSWPADGSPLCPGVLVRAAPSRSQQPVAAAWEPPGRRGPVAARRCGLVAVLALRLGCGGLATRVGGPRRGPRRRGGSRLRRPW
jgi:hypothetical protein